MSFCVTVLKADRTSNIGTAIIFGLATQTTLLPEDSRAFLRHAFNQFYHDFANVDMKGTAFHWPCTFRDALLSYRDAVYRYGKRTQILFNTRYYSTLEGVVPLSARTRFPSLIDIGTEGDFSLTAAFQKAIDTAVAEADTYLQSLHAPRPGHYHRRN